MSRLSAAFFCAVAATSPPLGRLQGATAELNAQRRPKLLRKISRAVRRSRSSPTPQQEFVLWSAARNRSKLNACVSAAGL